ncbi:hypothetical protein Acr_17g0004560 [Actinidia rufa]|uniref:Glabrous enhancer-binding protein-like DBD domain-containing protein n=1 Tax=Actinidia rufa TaxID=165716 RepID=A0A7J0G262_9ERIC|nr:hypothetical protein Acr_17g0004560 [Actinidia rufa]
MLPGNPRSPPPPSSKQPAENIPDKAAVETEQDPEVLKQQSPFSMSDIDTSSDEETKVTTVITLGDIPTYPLQRKKLVEKDLISEDSYPLDENDPPSSEGFEVEDTWKITRIYSKKEKTKHPQSHKPLFEKSMSEEEDDFAILKFIFFYIFSTGVYPSPDSIQLHEFVKNSVGANVSGRLLRDKIMKLRKRFKKIVKKKGDDPNFSRPLHREMFELSRRIWGHENNLVEEDEQTKAMIKEQLMKEDALR